MIFLTTKVVCYSTSQTKLSVTPLHRIIITRFALLITIHKDVSSTNVSKCSLMIAKITVKRQHTCRLTSVPNLRHLAEAGRQEILGRKH